MANEMDPAIQVLEKRNRLVGHRTVGERRVGIGRSSMSTTIEGRDAELLREWLPDRAQETGATAHSPVEQDEGATLARGQLRPRGVLLQRDDGHGGHGRRTVTDP